MTTPGARNHRGMHQTLEDDWTSLGRVVQKQATLVPDIQKSGFHPFPLKLELGI